MADIETRGVLSTNVLHNCTYNKVDTKYNVISILILTTSDMKKNVMYSFCEIIQILSKK
jgi:hypothetical protein